MTALTWADKARLTSRMARIGAGALADRFAPRKAKRAGDVPASVEMVTPEYLYG